MVILVMALIYLSSQNQIMYDNQYKTKGINEILVDLSSLGASINDVYKLNVYLKINGNRIAYLAYCDKTSVNAYKNILSSPESIKNSIELQNKDCLFDNNAVIGDQFQQQLILTNELDSEFIMSRFSAYKISTKYISIFVYSQQETEYSVSIDGTNSKELSCLNGCNKQGVCVDQSNQPPICICSDRYLDSSCLMKAELIFPKSKVFFTLGAQQEQYLLLSIEDQLGDIYFKFNVSFPIDLSITCFLQFNYIPYKSSKTFTFEPIQNENIVLNQQKIDKCKQWSETVQDVVSFKQSPRLLLYIYNNRSSSTEIEIEIQVPKVNDINYLIYYIMGSVLGTLIIALIIIVLVIHFQRKSSRIKSQQLRLRKLTQALQMSKELQPEREYQFILSEYPGLSDITECQICLVEFQAKDVIRLTLCLHLFHSICLNKWMKRNQTCPECRQSLNLRAQENVIQIIKMGIIDGDNVHLDPHQIEIQQNREHRIKQLKEQTSHTNNSPIFDQTPISNLPLKFQEQIRQNNLRIDQKK